jgi:asparagine synthase (glutamine-hydrolysing)
MCGLVGIFRPVGDPVIDGALLDRMNESQHHRGPDAGGLHVEPRIGLGHRRLSIIDLSTGQQPLWNEDHSVVVVFNGEIYNFQDLVPELAALGHVFRTRSDTEVIVHAWEAWGEDCVKRFRGMFAFALWDRNRQTLFLARDRLGVKPMFYAQLADGTVVFGSELKSLQCHPRLPREIDPTSIEDYLALGYVPEPKTIFRDVWKLEPAHTIALKVGDRSLAPQREYWDVHFAPDASITEADALAELGHRLDESVRLRMISEVPLGAFLSGGVDSSAVVATMAKFSGEPVNTCSISFSDPRYDEAAYAKQVADRYRTNHRVETVEVDDFDLLDRLVGMYDEPYADSSAIPTFRVCELARKNVTVALSGDGGDENFAGYRRYRFQLAEERMRSLLPRGIRRPLFGALGAYYPKADWAPRPLRAKSTLLALARDGVDGYFHSTSLIRDEQRRALYSPVFRQRLGGYDAVETFHRHARKAETDDPLSLVQYLDLKTYLVGDINTKVDRASMANSLEVREPLMDHPLVEWLATLPRSLKIRDGEGKYLLKKAMEPRLPREILYRPKMGFAVPLASWFRGPLRKRVREALLGPTLLDAGIFERGELERMVEAHQSGRRDFASPIWTLLMLEGFLARQGTDERASRDLHSGAGAGSGETASPVSTPARAGAVT